MKLIIILLTFSSICLSRDICITLNSTEAKVDCRYINQTYTLNKKLFRYCIQQTYDDQVAMSCIRSLINKSYTDEDVNFCLGTNDYKCFSQVGEFKINLNEGKTCLSMYTNMYNTYKDYLDESRQPLKFILLTLPVSYSPLFHGGKSYASFELFRIEKGYKILHGLRVNQESYELYNFIQDIISESNIAISPEQVKSTLTQLDLKQSFCKFEDYSYELDSYEDIKEKVIERINQTVFTGENE